MRDRRADDREPPLRRPPLRSDREERMFIVVFLKTSIVGPARYSDSARVW